MILFDFFAKIDIDNKYTFTIKKSGLQQNIQVYLAIIKSKIRCKQHYFPTTLHLLSQESLFSPL